MVQGKPGGKRAAPVGKLVSWQLNHRVYFPSTPVMSLFHRRRAHLRTLYLKNKTVTDFKGIHQMESRIAGNCHAGLRPVSLARHGTVSCLCLCSWDLNTADCGESVDSSVMLIFGGYI